jgi:signal transduction histidine kinase
VSEARALQARVGKVLEDEAERHKLRTERLRAAIALAVLLGLGVVVVRRRSRQPLGRALRSQPLLFPALVKAMGQIRHDVLKHRASALELLAEPATNRQDVARALLEPAPASADVAAIFERLAQDARAVGVRLCPLAKEPVLGPLAADLARAEALVQRPDSDVEARLALQAVDQRLRGRHGDRLQALVRSGPRTVVDTPLLARWIEGVLGATDRPDRVVPGVALPAADVAFPLPKATLCAMVSNLVRNALDAVTAPAGKVELRVEQGRDGTGRSTVTLWVADSCPRLLDLATIDNRPSDRGLGIVRDTVRAWGGEVLVREEAAPFHKSVGVRFPAPPEGPR